MKRVAHPETEERLRFLIDNLQEYAVFALDTQGRVLSWNSGAERIFGYPAHDIIGKHFSVLYPQEDLRSGKPWVFLETALKAGRIEDEGWRGRKDGSQFWANVLITVLREPDGGLAGFGAVVRDFSERKRAEEALRLSEERFRSLVQGVTDYAIVMLDPEGRINSWNEGAELIHGYKAGEVIGKHFAIIYPEEDLRRGKPAWELEVASRTGRFEDHGWRVRKDGTRFWANVIVTALHDGDGRPCGFGKVTRDITRQREAEEALRASEERFRLLVQGVRDYAIFMLDPRGNVTSWNEGAQRIKGYTASEIIGKHISVFYTDEDAAVGKAQLNLERAVKEGRIEDEGWRVRKDGSRFWASVVITALRDDTGALYGFSKVTRDITEKRRAQQALEKSHAALIASEHSLRELSGRLLRMQDEERGRLGRELHDTIGQYLSALKMTLEVLTSTPPPKRSEEQLAECIRITDDCIREVRTISYLLYPPMLEEMGLETAIEWHIDGFTKRSGIRVEYEVENEIGRLPRDIEVALFRIFQESLTNVHRHSGSPTAQVRLWLEKGKVILEVQDQGKGAPAGVLESSSDSLGTLGVGLRGMNERVRQLGGELKLASSDKGMMVRATIPLVSPAGSSQRPD
ncbi:MAG TPA: PAS domain S-box protein [Candidatus Acidoferrales bacterium]|nr:PAS domain S-box protein [Candidatus Acidoferrales bacterium]